MKNHLTRRSFVKRSALAASVFATAPFNILHASNAGDKIRCVQIGCGGRGTTAHLAATLNEHVAAIVDVDERRHASVKNWMQGKGVDAEKVQVFTDYRQMFDKIAKDFDAVFIATPNHHHALPAMIAMQLGKNVYCEKPVCHDISEARALRAMAAKTKVATQMGNQGHCEEGYRKLCEYIWAGAIGKVTETHSWTDRANGGEGPRPPTRPVPSGLHWDEYIGPAPYRDFHDDIHPHEWHGWYDFGNGSIGNMGCHVLDGVFWALKCEHPTSIEVEQLRGGSDERYPTGCRVRWDVPARGDMPALKTYWYEGLNEWTKGKPQGTLRAAKGDDRNLPPLLKKLDEEYPDEPLDRGDSGTLYVGEKGVIYTDTYGGRMHIVPYQKMKETPEPPKTLPRPKNIFENFLDAVRAGKTETAVPFEYGTRLTEFAILGNLAMKAGLHKKVMWDGPNMNVTNIPDLNAWVKRPYRDGWKA
ncbi:MAG TPA: Gfo/Idh/MocA family oxidoreductase [Verrucomicrobiae bacterium]|jgi:predicted dehydrogenase|nr:Gfo/Idh/MocA family oxidoreductase [Verrucomicrobiae bacterium]